MYPVFGNGNEDYDYYYRGIPNLVSYSILFLFLCLVCATSVFLLELANGKQQLFSHSLGMHLIETNEFVESGDQKGPVCRDFGMKKTLIRHQLQLENSENKELRQKRNRENNNLEVLQVLFGHQLGSLGFVRKKVEHQVDFFRLPYASINLKLR